jgi:signal transduction histidine kinase
MKIDKYFLKYFILNSVLFSVFTIFFGVLIVLYQFELKKNSQLESALVVSQDVPKKLFQRIRTYESILLITARLLEKVSLDDVESDFFIKLILNETMFENSEFYQLRYIDSTGEEVYRIDRRDDSLLFIDDDRLQNKKNRYYFKETIRLKKNEVYLSPIDLNVEHGEVEFPWVPTLRVSTQILDSKNGGFGVVIIYINLTADLQELFTQKNNENIYLLNKNGYFLAGPDSSILWGFMFDGNNSLKSINSELWEFLRLNDSGTKIQKKYSYAFSNFNVQNYLSEGDSRSYFTNEYLRVLVRVEISSPSYIPTNLLEVMFLLLVIITINILSYFISRMMVNKKESEREAKWSQVALVKSEKMASLGRLVAGIAHELNTPIGSSVTIASTLQDELIIFSKEINSGQIKKSSITRYLESAKSCTEVMMECLQRSSDLVTHFKRVSVDQSSEARRKFLVPDYINDIIFTLGPSLKNKNIKIEVNSRENIEVDSFPGPFAQIITNLVNNSVVHAFPGDSGGNIDIYVIKDHMKLKLIILDDGVGIPPENIDKIFDPFFTTASQIGGSGLGMHIVYNIITEVLNGAISVRSEKDKFTEFLVIIPISID